MGHLDEYIEDALAEGYSKKDIAKKLQKSGYSKKAIEDALETHIRPEHTILKISMGVAVVILFLLALFQMQAPQQAEEVPTILQEPPTQVPRMTQEAALNTKMLYSQVRDPTIIQLKACSNDCAYFNAEHLRTQCEQAKVEQALAKGIANGRCANIGEYVIDGVSVNMNNVCQGIVSGDCDLEGKEKGLCRAYLDPLRCGIEDPSIMIEDPMCKKKMKSLRAYAQGLQDRSLCETQAYLDDRIVCRALTQNSCGAMFETYTNDLAMVTLKKASLVDVDCDLSIPELTDACALGTAWQVFEDKRLGLTQIS